MIKLNVTLIAQMLFYVAGTVALIMLILLRYHSNERMQREHERIMLITECTLREVFQCTDHCAPLTPPPQHTPGSVSHSRNA